MLKIMVPLRVLTNDDEQVDDSDDDEFDCTDFSTE